MVSPCYRFRVGVSLLATLLCTAPRRAAATAPSRVWAPQEQLGSQRAQGTHTPSGRCDGANAVCTAGDWKLRKLDGSTTTLGDLRGRVVFVHVWATWCAVCRPELESIARLQRALSARPDLPDIAFVLVSPEHERIVSRFIRNHPVAQSVYVEATGAPRALAVRTVPTTLILDATGAVVARYDGRGVWDTDTFLDALLALSATSDSARSHPSLRGVR